MNLNVMVWWQTSLLCKKQIKMRTSFNSSLEGSIWNPTTERFQPGPLKGTRMFPFQNVFQRVPQRSCLTSKTKTFKNLFPLCGSEIVTVIFFYPLRVPLLSFWRNPYYLEPYKSSTIRMGSRPMGLKARNLLRFQSILKDAPQNLCYWTPDTKKSNHLKCAH